MKFPNPRRWAACVLGALMFAAFPAAAEIARQAPAACNGQREIRPLRNVTVVTAKGSTQFRVEVADTAMRREFGLMCRRALAADRGMLFDFKVTQPDTAFWMRNTLIALDIIYIRPDGRVLSIARRAKPLDEAPLPAGGPTRWVLELAADRAAQLGLMPGDKVIYRSARGG